jgi:RNA polymerase sigma factor (sigma-70 family)
MHSSPTQVDESANTSEGLEKAAFVEALSRRFRVPLARFFERRIGRQADIDDLVQEVFLRLASSGRIERVEEPEAYLFRTAMNLLHDRQRRLAARSAEVHEPYDEAIHGSARTTPTPERELLGGQDIQQLIAALYELQARTRDIWALYHLEDLAQAEIAVRLGVTVSTVEKHMSRATAHLLKRLERARHE